MENTIIKTPNTLKDQAVAILGTERVEEMLTAGVVAISREYNKAWRAFRNNEVKAYESLQLFVSMGGRA